MVGVVLLGGERRGAREAAQDEDARVLGDDGGEAGELGRVGWGWHAGIVAAVLMLWRTPAPPTWAPACAGATV